MGVLKRHDGQEPGRESWSVMQGLHDGKPLVARINQGAGSLAGDPNHNIRVGVAIPVHNPDRNGFPEAAELEMLASFEDALVKRTGQHATLVAVLTTRAMREFVLYTGSAEWIAAAHSDLRALLPTHEVQMVADLDPAWSTYRYFSEAIAGERA
jgi:hypothetical protein